MPRRRRHKRTESETQKEDSSCEPTTSLSSPYIVKKSAELGRYLVAQHDLPEAATVICEEALVVGPAQDSLPCCLGCYQPVRLNSSYKCEKCRWPLCSAKCRGLYRRHGHSREECSTLAKCEVSSPCLTECQLYNAVVPLRCLLLRTHQPVLWQSLSSMEAHNHIRRGLSSIWQYNQTTAVDRIRNQWALTEFSEEDIHTVCGILEVNAFAVGEDSLDLRGLYASACLLAHSCIANTAHTDDDNYRLTLYASLPIAKGDTISLSYTNTLLGTKKRRKHLKQCKFFDCACARCKDPTELNSYMSALKCSECSSGHLLSTDPLSDGADWSCNSKHCSMTLPAKDVDTITDRIESELKTLDQNSVEALEGGLRRYSKALHHNHYLVTGLRYTLSQMYGKVAECLIHEMSESLLERKRQHCEDMLRLFDILEPGLTQLRGRTMYELHAPIMVLTIQRFEMRKISKPDLCRRLRKVAQYLRECGRIFKFETRTSAEGNLNAAIENALSQLKSWESVVGKL